MPTKTPACPCGNPQGYAQCCGPYISGEKIPPNAEALMRSRYTAYTQANIPYIQASMQGPASERYNPVESERWAKTAKWKRLKVMRAFPDDTDSDKAYVEFIAYYIWQGKPQKIEELSVFLRVKGKWFYVDRVSST